MVSLSWDGLLVGGHDPGPAAQVGHLRTIGSDPAFGPRSPGWTTSEPGPLTTGATLVVVAAVAASATPASAGYHASGVNVGMADGSVRFIRDSVSIQTWRTLGTRSDGQVLSDY